MHNSPSNDIRIWTQHQTEYPTSQEETEVRSQLDYRDNFERNNELYNLRSQLNAAHLTLRKMALQQQQQTLEEQQFYQKMEAEKNKIEARQAQLEQEVRKHNLIAEAERNAKASFSSQLKSLKERIKEIVAILSLAPGTSLDEVVVQIQTLFSKQKLHEQTISQMRSEIESLSSHRVSEISILKAEHQEHMKTLTNSFSLKLAQNQEQIVKLLRQCEEKTKIAESYELKIKHLEKADTQLALLTQRCSQQSKEKATTEQQLVALRVKAQMLQITKQKWQEDKLKNNERLQELNFKLQLMNKKYELSEKRTKEQDEKRKQLEKINAQLRAKVKKSEEQGIQLQGSLTTLQHQLQICQVYKAKYKSAQEQAKQIQETLKQYQHITSQLEIQNNSYEEQLNYFEGEKLRYQEIVADMSRQLEEKDKEITKLTVTTNHQAELIKECRLEIVKYKVELSDVLKEAARKKSVISLTSQSNSSSPPSLADRQRWERMSEEIIAHYQNLLEIEDGNRRQWQRQLQSANQMVSQLRSQLNYNQKELSELTQENRLVRRENDRLVKTISVLHENHDKKIAELKERFKDLQKSTVPIVPPRSPKSEKVMNITSCYSIVQENKGRKAQMSYFGRQQEKKSEEGRGHEQQLPRQSTWLRQNQVRESTQPAYEGRTLSYSRSSELHKVSELDEAISKYKESNWKIKSLLKLRDE